MTITVIRARGVGERVGQPQMLDLVTAQFPQGDMEIIDAPWSGSYGPVGGDGSSYAASLAEDAHLVRSLIRETPNLVVLLGYSGGAGLMGHVAASLPDHPELQVSAVGLVADPFQPRGLDARGLYGVAGSRPIDVEGVYVRWAFHPLDPIPCTAELSPLRTFADQSLAFSLTDLDTWAKDMVNRLMTGRWQASAIDWRDPVGTANRYAEALRAVAQYNARHVQAYIDGPQLGFLAQDIRRQVWG